MYTSYVIWGGLCTRKVRFTPTSQCPRPGAGTKKKMLGRPVGCKLPAFPNVSMAYPCRLSCASSFLSKQIRKKQLPSYCIVLTVAYKKKRECDFIQLPYPAHFSFRPIASRTLFLCFLFMASLNSISGCSRKLPSLQFLLSSSSARFYFCIFRFY